eukprot:396910-Pleurochrysis_carterae.AAC.4
MYSDLIERGHDLTVRKILKTVKSREGQPQADGPNLWLNEFQLRGGRVWIRCQLKHEDGIGVDTARQTRLWVGSKPYRHTHSATAVTQQVSWPWHHRQKALKACRGYVWRAGSEKRCRKTRLLRKFPKQ